jgi:hypothetical protein
MRTSKHWSLLLLGASIACFALVAAPASPVRAATIAVIDATSDFPVIEYFTGHYEISGIYIMSGFGEAAERFDGQTVSEIEGWEVVNGVPNSPCTLLVPGLHDGVYLYQDELQGVANGTASEDIGEGAVSFRFEANHYEMGLDINKMNGGTVTLTFFTRDGDPLDTLTVSHTGDRPLTFRVEEGPPFAGVNITNRDNAGASFDNLRLGPGAGIQVGDIGEPPIPAAITAGYPNPFITSTTVRFSLSKPGTVSLSVYSVDGREVATLVNGSLPSGIHEVTWDGYDKEGNEAASGVYILEMRSSGARHIRKAVKVR